MGTKTIAMLGLALALGACGKSGNQAGGNGAARTAEAGNASAPGASASAPAVGGSKLRPGLYETAMEMKVAGLPPQVAQAMQHTKMTSRSCVTPEEANRPSGELFSGNKAEGCEAKDLAYEGGRIHGTMTCAPKHGVEGSTSITMDGSYGGESFDIRTKVVTAAQGRTMTMEGHTVGRRIGDCPAGGKEG
ncbi:MAG: hypothetical protein QOH04_2206 [Sphingomonadales bacterium]|jgi:hypothetical protein|nr:hypothetical protein [Sphingomonadales bacterium]MEA3036434.1 hypothetical protein [Sphingomonadales bacterium]